ncbi:MAG: hypothetical protein ACHBN1_24700 [Heteroscytonema crispum UTEX LB 1556]
MRSDKPYSSRRASPNGLGGSQSTGTAKTATPSPLGVTPSPEDCPTEMSDAQILTTAVCAAMFFDGNRLPWLVTTWQTRN